MASQPMPDPWVRIADVLAEVAGVDSPRSFDAEARALASTMRGVRHDWAGRPCVTWSTAAELLESLRAEAARKRAAIEERLIAADQRFRAQLPPGVPVNAVPPGVSVAQLWMAADPMGEGSQRVGVLEHALAHPAGAIVYTPIRDDRADQ